VAAGTVIAHFNVNDGVISWSIGEPRIHKPGIFVETVPIGERQLEHYSFKKAAARL
jgi:hypothetical protein